MMDGSLGGLWFFSFLFLFPFSFLVFLSFFDGFLDARLLDELLLSSTTLNDFSTSSHS